MTVESESPMARAIRRYLEAKRRRAEQAALQAQMIDDLCTWLDCTPDELRAGILRFCKTHGDKSRQNPTT